MEIDINAQGDFGGLLVWLLIILPLLVYALVPKSTEVDLKPHSKKPRPYNPFFMDEE